ncbi:hypothetical protein MYSTI_03623 [Myxococcus stipitatus DSM 14675]|uniref:Uncharacterized protein n=1 Tax=Myxococcus stipitatus (strain DSM 14675 / JCM 12634 / Mx s8) TaxID=1278073 RepID=L7UET3_MYXSD|nr:hypothetical protein [Myxococcus stipitatus]AGC44929.1 hypothetical protein MYSTI_03623 [Myxococcus stipitatus DSM 14675]
MHYAEPLAIYSLHFDRGDTESRTIPLWNPVTDARLGEQPEWIRGARSEPVAYVRGSRPSVRVSLLANHFVPPSFELSAFGPSLCPAAAVNTSVRWLGPHPVSLERTAGWNTLAEPVHFNRPLPNHIGVHALELQWFAEWTDADGTPRKLFLGNSHHELFTTGAPMRQGETGAPPRGAYTPLLRWSSRWCAGLESRKDICDALLRGLPETGLRYGVPAWTVRHMLAVGGGMCGGWYQLFQQLANCQGVTLEGRTLHLLPHENPRTDEVRWEALVAVAPGLNQVEPSRLTRLNGRFQDSLRYPFAPDEPVELLGRVESRYAFMSGWDDGHCLNFLEDSGRLYLYDACFLTEAVELDMPLPPADGRPVRLSQESSFRRRYLHPTLPRLMGTLRANGRLWEVDLERNELGITVGTEQVPEIDIMWTR